MCMHYRFQYRQTQEFLTGNAHNHMKDRRIKCQALESIMRDVLEGMQDFTCDVSASSEPGEMTVLSVERPDCQQTPMARVIPFPSRHRRK